MAPVDIVVVSFNSRDHLRSCVEPLARTPAISVTVVDNASTDNSLDSVADLDLRLIPLTDNRGFAHGCNVGWRAGTAPLVLFLNPDALAHPDAVQRLAEVLETEPSVGVVGPRIVHPDGTVELSQHRFPRLWSTFGRALFLHRIFPRGSWLGDIQEVDAYSRSGSPDWIGGACLLLRRSTLEELGGFDERFFMYCEDMDLCRRLRDRGFDVRFEASATVVHVGGGSADKATLFPRMAKSQIAYAEKHRGRLGARVEQLGVVLLAFTHTVIAHGGLAARAGHLRALRTAVRRGG
jgi:N-acetylglucosaminyl-diphospho-decaprenol L-rhamnosyltransferase